MLVKFVVDMLVGATTHSLPYLYFNKSLDYSLLQGYGTLCSFGYIKKGSKYTDDSSKIKQLLPTDANS